MTQDSPAMSVQQQPPNMLERTDGMLVELAHVQKHALELLGRLDRQPRNLRIQAGAVIVDITWADEEAAAVTRSVSTSIDGVEHPDDEAGGEYLTSPGVGVFYHAREPGAEPFVSVGSLVQPGQQIGIIEAMKLMIPVEADRAGRIISIVKANGEPVEYGEPLFALDVELRSAADV
jgi:acetyl-CoA carboxylase biotin carboxyl carrier protein